jgi:hypothetical protein
MNPLRQGVEVESRGPGDDDLTIEDATIGQIHEQVPT